MSAQDVARPDYATMAEFDLVRRARTGERGAFRAIMQRGNQRLFRVARGIVRDEAEAEDVVQEAYVRAFAGLAQFRGEASIFTWLTRIVVNEANGRLRKRRNEVGIEEVEAVQSMGAHVIMFPNADASANPEEDVARMQVRRVIERAVDELPDDFRTVFILRDIEDCSVAETAAVLIFARRPSRRGCIGRGGSCARRSAPLSRRRLARPFRSLVHVVSASPKRS